MAPMDRATARTVLAAVVVGAIGWAGLFLIGYQLWAASAATLGFDLELLLQAAREIVAGRSPYAPELVAGGAPTATGLFYSYPPPVAQALTPFAAVPSVAMLVGWGIVATIGWLVVVEALRRRLAPERRPVAAIAVAFAAETATLPLSVGLLFGNLDAFFPFLYGLMLVAALTPTPPIAVAGGAALVLASLKLHPASMGLWFLVRAVRGRAPGYRVVLASAVVLGAAVVGLSVAIGGSAAWLEYADVIRAGTNAIVVDPRNAGPAAAVAGLLGEGDATARSMHLAVAGVAVAVTVWAAWRRHDPLESFAWATAASLATLPVTWYHYPSAMLPIAIAAWLRSTGPDRRRVQALLLGAGVVAALALVALPLLWAAVALVVVAAAASRPDVSGARSRMIASRMTHDSIQTTGRASQTATGTSQRRSVSAPATTISPAATSRG